jgi:phosphoribosylformylglycinamidine synthase
VAAIGGKDSMSGSFLDLDVPPTLISFAIAPSKAPKVLSPEFKTIGDKVYLFEAPAGDYEGTRRVWDQFHALCQTGKVKAAWAVGAGGVMEGLMKMAFGNELGFTQAEEAKDLDLFAPRYGSILAEVEGESDALLLGKLGYSPMLEVADTFLSLNDLQDIWETTLEEVYPTQADTGLKDSDMIDIFCSERSPLVAGEKFARPRAVIPVFPGTNCEYDTANACIRAGIEPEIVVVRNLDPKVLHESADALAAAIGRSQMMILPGGFSGGDEPDGSAKFIVSFLRNPKLTDAVHELLKHRDGLMLGICNGFQALVKLGLVPYGEIRQTDDSCPTLTFNLIGRHQSRYVTTRVASVKSPWMLLSKLDDMHSIPVSHGEGRFVAPPAILSDIIANGQVGTQYVDTAGIPSLDISVNPNGSVESIEGIFSPDGRVYGKMGHSERYGEFVAKNIPGNKHQPLFESGALYFK